MKALNIEKGRRTTPPERSAIKILFASFATMAFGRKKEGIEWKK
jgi:hypothetical protein